MNKQKGTIENSCRANLSVDFCGFEFRNPVGNASGCLSSSGAMLKRLADLGAGFVTTKSISLLERPGYANPSLVNPRPGIFINAMGLPNSGVEHFAKEIPVAKAGGVPVIGSVYGNTSEEYAQVATIMVRAGADIIEANVSCPHQKKTSCALIAGQDPVMTREILTAIRNAVPATPISVKLSPNVTDIGAFARVAVECKVDAITAINTVQATVINAELQMFVLANKFGGQSGPSIKYIAQKKVIDIAMTLENMKESGELKRDIPIIAAGGIETATDAIEFMLIGAKCVQVGSAIADLEAFPEIITGLSEYMQKKGYRSLDELRGKMLKQLRHK